MLTDDTGNEGSSASCQHPVRLTELSRQDTEAMQKMSGHMAAAASFNGARQVGPQLQRRACIIHTDTCTVHC